LRKKKPSSDNRKRTGLGADLLLIPSCDRSYSDRKPTQDAGQWLSKVFARDERGGCGCVHGNTSLLKKPPSLLPLLFPKQAGSSFR